MCKSGSYVLEVIPLLEASHLVSLYEVTPS